MWPHRKVQRRNKELRVEVVCQMCVGRLRRGFHQRENLNSGKGSGTPDETKEKKMSKPKAKLVGENGNIFNVLGICKKAMQMAGEPKEKVEKMLDRVMMAPSYNHALAICMEYVDFE